MANIVLLNDGKVKINADGKVFKQNYDFGKGLYGTPGYFLQSKGQIITPDQPFTMVCFLNFQGIDNFKSIFTAHDGTHEYGGVAYDIASGGNLESDYDTVSVGALINPGNPPVRLVNLNINMVSIGYSGTGPNMSVRINGNIGGYPYIMAVNPSGYWRFNYAVRYSSTATVPLTSNIRFFNRYLSDDEIKYLYNNASGNDARSEVGQVCFCPCQSAEILDFSAAQDGSDMRVGTRDTSGFNHHLFFANLPGGTLSDQLAFVNSQNLFRKFQ